MKGLFFTEFLEMVEKEYGWQVVEKIISELGIANRGVYNPQANYPYRDFENLLHLLSLKVGLSVSALTKNFGKHLFYRLVILYRSEFARKNIFDFLEQIDELVHVKMQDRFPHEKIKGLQVKRLNESCFQISFQSKKDMVDLAIGFFAGCQQFFNENLTLDTEYTSDSGVAKFSLSKKQVLI